MSHSLRPMKSRASMQLPSRLNFRSDIDASSSVKKLRLAADGSGCMTDVMSEIGCYEKRDDCSHLCAKLVFPSASSSAKKLLLAANGASLGTEHYKGSFSGKPCRWLRPLWPEDAIKVYHHQPSLQALLTFLLVMGGTSLQARLQTLENV